MEECLFKRLHTRVEQVSPTCSQREKKKKECVRQVVSPEVASAVALRDRESVPQSIAKRKEEGKCWLVVVHEVVREHMQYCLRDANHSTLAKLAYTRTRGLSN
jgi:hypothetical protein